MKTHHSSKGFTLMEIMMVVAILGIIGAIAIPMYGRYTENAYAVECANEVAAMRLAEEEFFLVNNRYFLGGNLANPAIGIPAIEAASAGVYRSGYRTAAQLAAANCGYLITAGTTGNIASSYNITAIPTATGQLANVNLNMTAGN